MADDVDAPRPGRVSFGQHIRGHVVQHAAEAAGEAVAADGRKMVDDDAARNGRVVMHVDMPAQQRGHGFWSYQIRRR